MAKRKRLTPAQTGYLDSALPPVLETKSVLPGPGRPPIAQVAGEASAAAALDELAGEMRRARDEGRLIQTLPEDSIDAGYLVRDRMIADDDELRVLMQSLQARGQQTPVEVVATGDGRYGLISGWRRLTALRRLLAETGEARFAAVRAVLRRPETAAEAYVAMVEENEIRVGLSYYERARVAAKAVEQGVYDTEKAALLDLFAAASRAKRSKIRSYLAIYHALDGVLRFPTAIPERLGLAIARQLEADPGFADRLRAALAAGAETPEAETAALERALTDTKSDRRKAEDSTLKRLSETKPAPAPDPRRADGGHVAAGPFSGVYLAHDGGGQGDTITLTGPGVDPAFRAALTNWLKLRR